MMEELGQTLKFRGAEMPSHSASQGIIWLLANAKMLVPYIFFINTTEK